MTEDIKNTGGADESLKNKPAKAVKKSSKPRSAGRITKWFRELRSESKKVMWPSRKQIVNNTFVVIVTVAVVGAFVWVVDLLLQQSVALLVQYL